MPFPWHISRYLFLIFLNYGLMIIYILSLKCQLLCC
jgi:hypothetical protein